jgi:hypothetical protein
MKNLLVVVLFLLLSCGTSQKVNVMSVQTPLAPTVEVKVFGAGQTLPTDLKMLGSLKIGDSGITSASNCTYDKVIANAQAQARGMGGNVLQVTKKKEPSVLGSTCYRIWCDVYYDKKSITKTH